MIQYFRSVFVIGIPSVMLTLLVGCKSLPETPHLPKSLALTKQVQERHQMVKDGGSSGGLISAINAQSHNHPHQSGYYPIATGANAFAARSTLTDMANQSIDIQYYIWHNDEAGQLMLKDLWEAADRGVIVRLLLDDFNSSPELDQLLLRISEHPNIAVRLINPMNYRGVRSLNYVLHPVRSNRRMHNKSMTFDNKISVIGGRNIGNEYLNNAPFNNFADLDVMLVGHVVGKITESFETYWASSLSFDIETLVKHDNKDDANGIKPVVFDELEKVKDSSDAERELRTYRQAMQNSTIGQDLLTRQVPFFWTQIDLMVDNVVKLNGRSEPNDFLVSQLQARLGQPSKKLSIISSYFVPTKDGVETLTTLAKMGVEVNILTNSFDATDVGIVHAGYAHWRKQLLAAGVRLFEIKSSAQSVQANENRFWRTRQHSTTSLHAKAFAVDDDQVFIGSYNVDPRSANINTELGVLIKDGKLADQLHNALSNSEAISHQAYELKLDPQGNINWHTTENGEPVILKSEPHMDHKDRIIIWLAGLMPIDWLL
ncbi:phospholipase D family protein [Moraxella canis]|uniref:phospholipase D family protein n=1 Tax=Moraxella canis TaxID=90239 RepID=UPI000664DCC2|nr:phospholipase D family protein [Moraxella canis]